MFSTRGQDNQAQVNSSDPYWQNCQKYTQTLWSIVGSDQGDQPREATRPNTNNQDQANNQRLNLHSDIKLNDYADCLFINSAVSQSITFHHMKHSGSNQGAQGDYNTYLTSLNTFLGDDYKGSEKVKGLAQCGKDLITQLQSGSSTTPARN